MDRRNAVKAMAGTLAVGGAGYFGLKNLFKHKSPGVSPSKKIEFVSTENEWKYNPLDPEITSQVAYDSYKKGG